MHIYYFTPFSIEKDFFKEIDHYMSLISNSTDWACIMDGDTLFLRSDFGNCIADYVHRYPDTGMFTCYASRCHYQFQVPRIGDMDNTSLDFHKSIANELHQKFQHTQTIKIVKRRIAGHLMLLQKSIWDKIRDDVYNRVMAGNKKILGVDTQISYSVLQAGLDIKLMKGIYLLHYLRLKEGFDNETHLK